ncbi:MAG: hypothetical protein QXU18_15505 [Thermoplasmatales archaeon]
MHIFLSHDVDWPKGGPGADHIFARRERFDEFTLGLVKSEGFNPYYGIPTMMDIEKSLGIRSTFFFRPLYDDSSTVDEYRMDLSDFRRGGWEVGLHANHGGSLNAIKSEKAAVEEALGDRVIGVRVHYLRIAKSKIQRLGNVGFNYDSSVCLTRDKVDEKNSGSYMLGDIVEFPITYMDAYIFTYMGITESNVVNFLVDSIGKLSRMGIKLVTLLWHDNVLLMKGGREYQHLLETLVSKGQVSFLRGIDAVKVTKEWIEGPD